MPVLCDKDICCGCGLCEQICLKNAISMQPNEEGFMHPVIDKDLCVECGICQNRCPVVNSKDILEANEDNVKKAYAGYFVDRERLLASSSGGIVQAMAYSVLQEGGVVFGVKYKNDFSAAEYTYITRKEDMHIIAKSKYVEADRKVLYEKLPEFIASGRKVLVAGLPCDIAAVRSLVGYPDNLITCRLICMAIPTRKSLQEYIARKEEEYSGKLVSLDLRYKKPGEPTFPTWVKLSFDNGKSYEGLWTRQDHYRAFFIMNRPSCNECHFKAMTGYADLTVGDFQGLSSSVSYYNPNGVSLIFSHTDRGEEIISSLNRDEFYVREVDYAEAAAYNWMIFTPYPKSLFRDSFSRDFVEKGLYEACKSLREDQNNKLDEVIAKYANSDIRVAIWGAGDTAEHMYHRLEMDKWNVVAAFDSSTLRIGGNFFGVPVHALKEISEYAEKFDVLVAFIPSENEEKLNKSVIDLGCNKPIVHVGKYKYYTG